MNTLEQLRSGALAGARTLRLAGHLREFPPEIFSLANSLEVLDLSGNDLSSLPEDLSRLHQLRILFCSDNKFTELPEVLGRCPRLDMVGFKANRIRTLSAAALPARLRWLILTDNQLQELSPDIGRCKRLQKLMLAGNQLQELPAQLAACTRLELLRIAANRLPELPPWLLAMPRLTWLAYAGNPFCALHEQAALSQTPLAAIPWDALWLQQLLGEGASGVIHQAEHRVGAGVRPVAVKLFKSAVTSDGLPMCEMAACLHAAAHPNLIPVLGRVAQHPAQAQGLVMHLVGPEFCNLAGPPSLESCTRDSYAPTTRFDLDSLLQLASGIASAARHLHQRGILHGDLYGHNILHSARGQALLGDFGAASFFEPGAGPSAPALQRLEVRAFGCLLEELVERCAAPETSDGVMDKVMALQRACLNEDTVSRPLFEEIERSLLALVDAQKIASSPSVPYVRHRAAPLPNLETEP
jgi:hypothetical protein